MPDRDDAENMVRSMLEASFMKLVGSFHCFAEAAFASLSNAGMFAVKQGLFQRLRESSDLWRRATGKGYDDLISSSDLQELERFFQQRHVLAHKEGLIDDGYIAKTGDKAHAPGERLIIREKMVLRLAEIISLLAGRLRELAK